MSVPSVLYLETKSDQVTTPTALPCPRETPSGGTVTYSMSGDPLPAGTMATYSCDTGYDLIGDETRTCTEENGWTGSLPICKS